MKIEHLISTMYQKTLEFTDSMRCKTDILLVNQTNEEFICEETNEGITRRMISVSERGLSNSRNMLIKNAKGDIGILGDDDLIYMDGYLEIVKAAYERHPDADIIAFSFTQDMNINTRRQFKKEKQLNIFTISKISSVEITFKIKSIREKKIQYCPLLGLGAPFGACEENAFLADALRAGLKIWYVPKTICYLKPDPIERVKWKNGFDKDYFIKRGACFYRIYKNKFVFFTIAFLCLKKFNIFRNVNFFKAFYWMLCGRKEYINQDKNIKDNS